MTTSTGSVDGGQPLGGERRPRRAQAGGQGLAVDVGVLGQPGEVLHDRVGGVALALDGPEDEVAALGAEQVGADAGEHEAAEPLRVVARERERARGRRG